MFYPFLHFAESSITTFPNGNCSISADDDVKFEKTYYCDLHYSDDFDPYASSRSLSYVNYLSYAVDTTATNKKAVGMGNSGSISSSVDGSSDDSFYSSLSCEVGPPAGAVGYSFVQYYTEASCDGDKSYVRGVYGDHCFSDESHDEYFKYYFSSGEPNFISIIMLSSSFIQTLTFCRSNR